MKSEKKEIPFEEIESRLNAAWTQWSPIPIHVLPSPQKMPPEYICLSDGDRARLIELCHGWDKTLLEVAKFAPDKVGIEMKRRRDAMVADPAAAPPLPTHEELNTELAQRRRGILQAYARASVADYVRITKTAVIKMLSNIEGFIRGEVAHDEERAKRWGLPVPHADFCTRALLGARHHLTRALAQIQRIEEITDPTSFVPDRNLLALLGVEWPKA